MTTRLEKTLKREIDIDGKPHTLTITPEGVKITAKGARKGPEVSWRDILNGSTALMGDLVGSVESEEEGAVDAEET